MIESHFVTKLTGFSWSRQGLVFYIFLTVHLGAIRVKNQLGALFFSVFTSLLYTFRAKQCSSSGESTVSIHHLVYITLCRWPPDKQVPDLHTRRPPTQSDI